MGRWSVAAACLLIGCGQQAGRSGSGIVSGVDRQPAPVGGGGATDGGPVACVPGSGANVVANAGSGAPVCAGAFPGLPPPDPDVTVWFRLGNETCRAAWIDGRNDIVSANESDVGTDLWEHFANLPPDSGSLNALGELVQVYGPLEDGFFLQLLAPPGSPDPTYLFGWHLVNGPGTWPPGSVRPRAPSAGARNPGGGMVVAGAPGRSFPCDPDPVDPSQPMECTGVPDGIYLRAFGPDAAPRAAALRVFDPLGAGGRVAVGTEVRGWTLVLAIRSDGSTLGRWVGPGGDLGGPLVLGALPSGAVTDAVLAPLAHGGLAYRRNGEWVRVFDPVTGDAPPPCWLAGLAGFDLRIAADGNGYAAIPTAAVDRHCDRAIDLYTADGVPCGSVPLGTADERCTGHVTLGPQGSVLRLLDGPTFEAGHPTCEVHVWPELLGPSP